MNAETIEFIIRSRPVILEILQDRGYNIDSYKNVSPIDLMKIAIKPENLTIQVKKTEDGTEKHLYVKYFTDQKLKSKIAKMNLLQKDDESSYDPLTEEVICILNEPFHDVFHEAAIKTYVSTKMRVSFFNIRNLIGNPAKHIAVPPHRKLSTDEVKQVMTKLHVLSKSQFPGIRFHWDMQARVLGLVPGDLVEIKRPSPTAGEYTMYRHCV